MPPYSTSPFRRSPRLLVPGSPQYLFGSYNDKVGPTLGFVLSDQGDGTTSTVVFQIISGNVPVVNSLITIVGTANSGGEYNITNGTIASVVTTEQGVCTITFLNTATSASAQDMGQIIIPQIEVGESTSLSRTSIACAIPYNNVVANLNQALTSVVTFPVMPISAAVSLQQAVQDIDSEYQDVALVATVVGSAFVIGPQSTVDPTLGRFFRFNIINVSGRSATIVAKLLA